MRKQSQEVLRYASKEECLILLLASGDKSIIGNGIQDLYQKWQNLTPSQRREMDESLLGSLGKESKTLYRTLIEGFEIWDDTQNEEGAPGWCVTQSSLENVVKHMESDLMKLIHTMDRLWTMKFEHILKRNESDRNAEEMQKRKYTDLCSEENSGGYHLEETKDEKEKSNMKESLAIAEKFEQSTVPNSSKISLTSNPETLIKDTGEDYIKQITNDKLIYDNDIPPDSESQGMNDNEYGTNPFYDDAEDLSYDEDILLKNLRLDDCQTDSDFEKQISPMLSDEEFLT